MRNIFLIFFMSFVFGHCIAQNATSATNTRELNENSAKQFYIENKGQWNQKAAFLSRNAGLDGWILDDGDMLLDFYKVEKDKTISDNVTINKEADEEYKNAIKKGHRILLKWVKGNSALNFDKLEKEKTYYNYLVGNDASKYASNVGLYKNIVVENLYNGIDIRYYHQDSSMRYDIIAKPNSDPSQIKLKIEGSETIRVNEKGNIIISTSLGEVSMQDLYVYELETKKQITCKWILNRNELTLLVGNYNKNNTLIIDPLIYSTYLGGTNNQKANDIAIDTLGNAYITGATQSADFSTTLGSYQMSLAGIWDAFVSKLNTTGSAYVYSTFLGGSMIDAGNAITIDSFENIYVTGYTISADFPTTAGAFQTSLAIGGYDAFITKLNSTGTALIYSTYIGGGSYDEGMGIALDNLGNAYITGRTYSTNYPVTPGAFQTFFLGNYDVIVSKLNPSGTALVYSTYMGSSCGDDIGYDIAVDNLYFAYITGSTICRTSFITPGVHSSGGGGSDVFVSKLNTVGSARVYSTCIGGTGATFSVNSVGYGIAVDANGNAYVTGSTIANNFDVTSGAYQTVKGDTLLNEAFVFELNSTASALIYSTFLGGNGHDLAYDISIDNYGSAYITGSTQSTNFPTTSTAFQLTNDGSGDLFVSKFNINGTFLEYSTYLGGSVYDKGAGIAIETLGNAYVTGEVVSSNFDVTPGVVNPIFGGGFLYDGFVSKIDICATIDFNLTSNNITCNGANDGLASVTILNPLNYTYSWLPSGGSSITASGLGVGTYTVGVTDVGGCTSHQVFSITEPPPAAINGTSLICSGQNTLLSSATSGTYNWNTGDTTSNITVNPITTTTYSLVVTSGICVDTAYFSLNVIPYPIAIISGTSIICNGDSTTLTAGGGINYIWSTGDTTNTITISPSSTTNYSVIVSNSFCSDTAQFSLVVNAIPIATIFGTDSICNGQNTILTATGGATFNWSTGDTSNAITTSPIINTNYSVIVSNGPCADTAYSLVTVMPLPVAAISGIDSICLGQSTTLTATGGGTYNWSVGAISNSISVAPLINTSYNVIVTISGCSDTAITSVVVNPSPGANISGSTTICSGQSTMLSATGGGTYNWNTGSTLPTITVNPLTNTSYSVIVNNAFGCFDTATANVIVLPLPTVSISGNTTICEGETEILTASGIGSFLWNTGDTTSTISVTPLVATLYSVTASNSCGSITDTTILNVNALPIITISNDTTVFLGSSASIYATGGVSYSWTPSSGLSCSTCPNQTVSPETTTTYTVTIVGANGCTVTEIITITVNDNFEIFVPDIFSPNGDGENDVLYVRGGGIKELSFIIYDRLGEKIFESNDVSRGWDGTYKNALLNNAVFVYYISATMVNDEKIKLKGDVTLIR